MRQTHEHSVDLCEQIPVVESEILSSRLEALCLVDEYLLTLHAAVHACPQTLAVKTHQYKDKLLPQG